MERGAQRARRGATIAAMALAVACGRAGEPSVRAPEVPGFVRADLIDVLSPDQIPSIEEASFEPVSEVDWLDARAPVLVLERGGAARAYPLAILLRHEIVNDEVNGEPVVVTYCPLCGAAAVYHRRVASRVLSFGVSGKLYRSGMVMYDRETRSLWPQPMGVAVLGGLKGARLEPVPSVVASLADFRAAHSDGSVLERPTGARYDLTPYAGYESSDAPRLFRGPLDGRLDPMARVVGIAVGAEARAYPYADLAGARVVHDRLGGRDVVVFWDPGVRSPLDAAAMSQAGLVGTAAVFEPSTRGRRLRFAPRNGGIVDEATGSRWSILGRALDGPRAGARLEPVHHLGAFWFAWAALAPHTGVWAP